ncbi:MAG: hypothetical protein VYE44_06570, partial [Verrucomicrobiota bacterium]|nr:hypothetical protein [Verrucomicrobiota bacterium]
MKHIIITITINSLLAAIASAEPVQDAKNGGLVDFKRRSFSNSTWLQSFAKKESSRTGHRWS